MFVRHKQEDAATATRVLADAVAAALQTALNEKNHVVLAAPGGRSSTAFFEALSQKDLNWQNIGITLADERIVPITHTDSNMGLVCGYLLKNNAAVATWIPIVEDGESETGLQSEVVVVYTLKHHKQPDMLVLGMGSGRHTVLLFPQTPQLQVVINETDGPTLIHITPVTVPHERISVTLGAIAKTPNVFLAIQGAEKKAVFDKATVRADTEYLTSLILNHQRINCHVYYAC